MLGAITSNDWEWSRPRERADGSAVREKLNAPGARRDINTAHGIVKIAMMGRVRVSRDSHTDGPRVRWADEVDLWGCIFYSLQRR